MKPITLYAVAMLLFICIPFLNAATIKGQLLDEHKEPMIGANIVLSQSDKYAIVGLDGSFQINNIPIGTYTLTASYIGYATLEKSIEITKADQVLEIDLNLQPDVTVLNAVMVVANAEKGSDIEARKSEKNALGVVNIVSARTIELSPDITVANVVQRVSGVSILRNSNGDPQYAIVRGMDRRYNYTLVNGLKIPSPDNANRYIPLDIFPASFLEKLEVSKSLTPNMEGDAIGGVVNMVMKNAPNKLTIKGDLQVGYNQINLNRKFLKFDHAAVDFKTPFEKYGPLYQARFSDFSKQNLVTEAVRPLPDILSSFSIGNRFLKNKLGVLIAGGYQNSYRGNNSVWFLTTTDYFGSNRPSLDELHERTYSTQQTRYAGHLRLDYQLNEANSLKLYVGDYRLNSFQTRDDYVSQLDARFYSAEKGNAILSLITRTRITAQHIFTSSLQGDHRLTPDFKINWSAVASKARNDEPDIAQFERNTGIVNFVMQPVTLERRMPRTWQHNTDDDYTGYLNFIYNPGFLGREGELSVGGMYRNKQRTNFYTSYSFDPSPTTQTLGRDWNTFSDVKQVILNPLGSTADPQNYNAHEYLIDYYAQAKFLLLSKIQILGGVRVENTDQGYKLIYPTDPSIKTALSQKYTDVLPSINIKFMPNEHNNLRASYYKAIARPGYFEIVPYYNGFQSDGYPEVGNPDLKRVRAHNFDLRWEYFPNNFDQILIGVFYKKIYDPIEYATVLGPTNQPRVQPGNYGTANNWGVEFDYTKYFNKFGVKINYTYTDSRITTTKALRQRENPNDPTSSVIVLTPKQTRPLQGQAKHLGNLSLLYKDQKLGTNMQLAMVYTGERIENVSPFFENDSWVKPFVQMDFSVEQKLNKHWELTLKGQNLLNSPYEVIIKKPHLLPEKEYKLQDSSSSTLIRRDQYFQSYRIGVRFNF
jgi:outer membrane receptor protein involved in Fe transport